MDLDNEVESILRPRNVEEEDEEEKEKQRRPPSSYGSMKSDSGEEEEYDPYTEEEVTDEAIPDPAAVQYAETTDQDGTGLKLHRPDSPETLFTITTMQTKPPGALVIDTRSEDLEVYSDDDDEDMNEILVADSPEPPEFIEPEEPEPELQPGKLHPEQDLPYLFKTIQDTLSTLNKDDLYNFKMRFYQREKGITMQHVFEGDLLDFVDRTFEVLGIEEAALQTINTLELVNKNTEAEELKQKCRRSLDRYRLTEYYIRKHQIIREGVVRAGKQNFLNNVYVDPIISTNGFGGINPFHEFRPVLPTPVQVPSPDTYIELNNLFRQTKEDGTPVKTVVTTGIPGIGMTVSVGKYLLDWAEQVANKDLQFVFKLSFRNFWYFQCKSPPEKMSIMHMIGYYYPQCKQMPFLDEEGCNFLIIMDSFDCYRTNLDWKGAQVINDNHTKATPNDLIVNILRGNLLRGARIWVLGRRAAVTQIPSKFVDSFTELQGFNDEMKDDYLTKRFTDRSIGVQLVRHYKRQPSVKMLLHQPFICWMVAVVHERHFRYQGYGVHPPRLTPFYVNIVIVQMNRRLQFYYGKGDHDIKWLDEDKNLLSKMGKMGLKMIERNTNVFYEEDVKEVGLKVREVCVLSGMCTELPNGANGRRVFAFIHYTVQEFLAALHIFTAFRVEGKNLLESGSHMPKLFSSKDQGKSPVDMFKCALERTLNAPLGTYEMFLRFLCGMLNPQCHDEQLGGCLYSHNAPKIPGLDDLQRLLDKKIQNAPADRVENLKECLRELVQKDE